MADILFKETKDGRVEPGTLYAQGTSGYNLLRGGQWGAFQKPGIKNDDGSVSAVWPLSQPYLQQNVFCKVLDVPKWIYLLPADEAKKLKFMYISLFETMVSEIDGLNAGLNVEVANTPFAADGNEMYAPARVSYNTSDITMTITDRGNRDIAKFIEDWIVYGYGDPNTQIPRASKFLDKSKKESWANDPLAGLLDVKGMWSPEMYSMSCLFIEPDWTHRNVVKSFLCVNMFPHTAPEKTGYRKPTSARQTSTISINFKPITWSNDATDALARKVLAGMDVFTNFDPMLDTTLPIAGVVKDLANNKTGDHFDMKYGNDIKMENGNDLDVMEYIQPAKGK